MNKKLTDEEIQNIKIDKEELIRQTHEMIKKKGNYFEISVIVGKDEDNVMPIYDCHGATNYDIARMIMVLKSLIEMIKEENPEAYLASKLLGIKRDNL